MDTENRDQILYLIKFLSADYVQRYLKVTPIRTELLKKWKKDEQLLDSELGEMVSNGLIIQSDEVFSLTSEGRKIAQQNHAKEFGTYFIAYEQSAAYREMCKEMYGNNFCQLDMMTSVQLGKLLDVLNISNCQSILDAGCGTGAITEYIAGQTDGTVTGIDFSSDAIELAQNRTKDKRNRISFQVMDMDEIAFPLNSFDTIILIDTLYFVNDLDDTILALRDSLQEHGQMGIFYDSKISVGESKEMLRPENTLLAETLEKFGMQYKTWDFTAEEKKLWEKCLNLANKYKGKFVKEGNLALYESRSNEATRELEISNADRKRRYLFHAWL